jgi:hypothetical protein
MSMVLSSSNTPIQRWNSLRPPLFDRGTIVYAGPSW